MNQVLVETDSIGNLKSSKSCRDCPTRSGVISKRLSSATDDGKLLIAGVYYEIDIYSCQYCPDPRMTLSFFSGSYNCNCDSGYTLAGDKRIGPQSCVDSSLSSEFSGTIEDAASRGRYAPATIDSLVLRHYFKAAATGCKYHSGTLDSEACQILANLCVLSLYNFVTGACKAFTDIMALRDDGVKNVDNWAVGLPWLTYSEGARHKVCKDDSLKEKMSLDSNYLEYVVSTYSLNGTWLGYSEAGTIFNYCTRQAPHTSRGGGEGSSTTWQIFGAFEHLKLECDLGTLLNKPQLFYELFIRDVKTKKLHPIPVRLDDYITSSGSHPNADASVGLSDKEKTICDLKNTYVRRFILWDSVSAITESSETYNGKLVPDLVRYAKTINIEVSIQVKNPDLIYPPLVTIAYETSETATWGDAYSSTAGYQVKGSYTMDVQDFMNKVFAAEIAGVILVFLIFVVRWFNYRRRILRPLLGVDQTQYMELGQALDTCCLIMHSTVYIAFPALTLYAWYWFLFYKVQDTVAVMLPPQQFLYVDKSFYFPFVVLLHVTALFQLAYVFRFIYKQANADVFFLDWEPSSSRNAAKKTGGGRDGKVSVWRTILVANEWNELSVKRRTDIRFTLLFMTFFLLGLHLENNATQQPNLNDKSDGDLNVILRFANTTWWWFILSFAQWIWKFLIYERFVSEPPEQVFVDLCTVAKVSLLVLDEQYHGYYLHCRSPHQFADGSMEELVAMLHKEEAGLTVDRSMEGAPPDVQSFEIFLTTEWRLRFNKLYYSMMPNPAVSAGATRMGAAAEARMNGGNSSSFFLCRQPRAQPDQRAVKAWSELTGFLQEFFDNNFSKVELKRIVNDPDYIEALFRRPPNMFLTGSPCVFRPDRR
jgi:meckelin